MYPNKSNAPNYTIVACHQHANHRIVPTRKIHFTPIAINDIIREEICMSYMYENQYLTAWTYNTCTTL